MDGLKKIMYGVTDFPRMRRENAYFADRTALNQGRRGELAAASRTALAFTLVCQIGWMKVWLFSCAMLLVWSVAAGWLIRRARRMW